MGWLTGIGILIIIGLLILIIAKLSGTGFFDTTKTLILIVVNFAKWIFGAK